MPHGLTSSSEPLSSELTFTMCGDLVVVVVVPLVLNDVVRTADLAGGGVLIMVLFFRCGEAAAAAA